MSVSGNYCVGPHGEGGLKDQVVSSVGTDNIDALLRDDNVFWSVQPFQHHGDEGMRRYHPEFWITQDRCQFFQVGR